MKKEQKRYMLVEYVGCDERFLNSKDEYAELLNFINKHNNKSKKKIIFGNVSCERLSDGRLHVIVHKYHMLTDKMCISDLDNMTSCMSEAELINYYRNELYTKINEGFIPDINIAYFEDKNIKDKTEIDFDRGIKYIPVLYKDDVKYLDKNYIYKCLSYYADMKKYGFFLDLCNEFEPIKNVSYEIGLLREWINRAKYVSGLDFYIYQGSKSLYDAIIYEREKSTRVIRDENGNIQISRRRQRDFGFFVRDYGMKPSKRVSPVRYNKPYPNLNMQINNDINCSNLEDDMDFDDKLQEEYALISWDQDNGDYYDGYYVEYDHKQRKFIRK